MANRKISDLTALTAPAAGDLLPIVDISEAAAADKNKKITYGTFLSSVLLGTAAAPSIAFTGDTNTGIYSPGADQLAIATGGVGRIIVDASGNVNIDSNTLYVDAANNRVGIAISSPAVPLHVVGSARIQAETGGAASINLKSDRATSTLNNQGVLQWLDQSSNILAAIQCATQVGNNQGNLHIFTANTSNTGVPAQSSFTFSKEGRLGITTTSPGGTVDIKAAASTAPLVVQGPSSEFARIDSSGRLLVGTSTSVSQNAPVQIVAATTCQEWVAGSNGASDGIYLFASRSRGTAASRTVVQNGDNLAKLVFNGYSAAASAFKTAAEISSWVDGEPDTAVDTTDMPGRLVFSTSADGAAIPTEALRITNDRVIAYNQPTPATYAAAATLTVADLKTKIITYTGTAATLTLPTGTLTEGSFSGIYTNMTFEWSVINTGAGICTIGAGTDHTIVGSATVAIGASARFASRRTAANTFVSYRLS